MSAFLAFLASLLAANQDAIVGWASAALYTAGTGAVAWVALGLRAYLAANKSAALAVAVDIARAILSETMHRAVRANATPEDAARYVAATIPDTVATLGGTLDALTARAVVERRAAGVIPTADDNAALAAWAKGEAVRP